jgi:hypothetical protein
VGRGFAPLAETEGTVVADDPGVVDAGETDDGWPEGRATEPDGTAVFELPAGAGVTAGLLPDVQAPTRDTTRASVIHETPARAKVRRSTFDLPVVARGLPRSPGDVDRWLDDSRCLVRPYPATRGCRFGAQPFVVPARAQEATQTSVR